MVQLLITDTVYPTKIEHSIAIDRTTSDPVSTFKFKIQDNTSSIQLVEMQEVVILDEQQIPYPAHNLVLNPTLAPFSTNWTEVSTTGGTFTGINPGVELTASNISAPFGMIQTLHSGLVTPGQSYMASIFIAIGSALTNCQWYLTITALDATSSVLVAETNVGTGAASPAAVSFLAPTGTVYLQMAFGVQPTVNGSNSGSATFTVAQLEPMTFASSPTFQLTYPTPACNATQPNCRVLPDGTTVRQYRLFGGYITKATTGNYMGIIRTWTVQTSGYAWFFQKQLLNQTWTNYLDSTIIGQLVSTYFPGFFSTVHVTAGSTLDTFGYQYNGTARDALDALSANANYIYFVDDYRDIWYCPPGYNSAGFGLSDNPDNVTTFPYFAFSLDRDGTQLGNACLVTGATNISAIEYDPQSIAYYNQLLDGLGTFWRTVSDSTITTTPAAQQRAIAENTQYNYARSIAHLTTNQPMQPGLTVPLTSAPDQLDTAPYLVQKSSLVIKGINNLLAPTYEYSCDLGDYNPDMVNITVKMLRQQSKNNQGIGTPVLGLMATETLYWLETIQVAAISSHPGTYGLGIYGTSTYGSSGPRLPSTTYGYGTYGDPSHGYN
jgi:hypothetical protein